MANNTYVNKVEYGGNTLIDLTGDTVTASDMLAGVTAHDRSGATIQGTLVPQVDVGFYIDAQGYLCQRISTDTQEA